MATYICREIYIYIQISERKEVVLKNDAAPYTANCLPPRDDWKRRDGFHLSSCIWLRNEEDQVCCVMIQAVHILFLPMASLISVLPTVAYSCCKCFQKFKSYSHTQNLLCNNHIYLLEDAAISECIDFHSS